MAASERVPLLWICGPAGVGKTTVSWRLYQEVAGAGVRVAFADSDQLCMCYPAPPGDPGRQHVKALNVGAMIPNFRAAGAQCVIVNGVLDPAGLDTDLLPDADVTICRLRAAFGDIGERFAARHGRHDGTDGMPGEIRNEARQMDASSFAGACVDTTGVPAADVAGQVPAACPDWPGFTGQLSDAAGRPPAPPARPAPPAAPARAAGPAGGHVALITGPTGVGKSTIGFSFYTACVSAGLTAGYVDLSQIGFLRPAAAGDQGSHQLKARNLAAIWRTYLAAGATHLVAAGPIASPGELQQYTGELPGADISLVRLRAGAAELRQRVMSRGAGGSWPEPGDRLAGQSTGALTSFAVRAVKTATALDQSGPAGLTIDTTSRSPQESASLIRDVLGWPPRKS